MLATQENATWLQRKCENIVLALCGKVKQTDFVVVCTCSLLSYFVAVFAKVELLTLILLKPTLACNNSFINLINSNKKIFPWKFEKHARIKSNLVEIVFAAEAVYIFEKSQSPSLENVVLYILRSWFQACFW